MYAGQLFGRIHEMFESTDANYRPLLGAYKQVAGNTFSDFTATHGAGSSLHGCRDAASGWLTAIKCKTPPFDCVSQAQSASWRGPAGTAQDCLKRSWRSRFSSQPRRQRGDAELVPTDDRRG